MFVTKVLTMQMALNEVLKIKQHQKKEFCFCASVFLLSIFSEIAFTHHKTCSKILYGTTAYHANEK